MCQIYINNSDSIIIDGESSFLQDNNSREYLKIKEFLNKMIRTVYILIH